MCLSQSDNSVACRVNWEGSVIDYFCLMRDQDWPDEAQQQLEQFLPKVIADLVVEYGEPEQLNIEDLN